MYIALFILLCSYFNFAIRCKLALFQGVPLWPQHGGEFDFQKLNLKHSTDSSLSVLNLNLNHKVCLA